MSAPRRATIIDFLTRRVMYAAKDPASTDYFQASWVEHRFGEDIAFDQDAGEWHRYDPSTGLWPVDPGAASIRHDIYVTANGKVTTEGEVTRESDRKALLALLDIDPVRRALESLSTRPNVRTTADAWDRDPNLLGCSNGVLDLRLGRLLSPDEARSKRVTMSTGLPFEPGLTPDRFIAHLKLVQPDAAMRAYLWRTFGYMLTGETGEQTWWFWYGPKAANGKSQTADVIRLVLGDYGKVVQPALFVREGFKNPINIGSSIHDIRKARVGDLAELSHVAELDSETLKRLVEGAAGGFTYRKPYGHGDMTAHPPVKFIGHGNSRPTVTDSGNGFWRRTVVIPWDEVVPEEARIKDYATVMLAEEGPAILSLLARKAQAYYKDGLLTAPGVVTATTAAYRASADHFATWVNDVILVTGKTDDRFGAQALFDRYLDWCNDQNVRTSQRVSGQDFKERLFQATSHALDHVKTKAGMVYVGLTVAEA